MQEWSRTPDGRLIQQGHLVVSLNPELHPIGNFVVRGPFQRLEWARAPLASLRRKCLAAVQASGRPYAAQVETLRSAWAELEENARHLEVACRTGPECVLRESCVVLTQIYAAIHPSPDVGWLGLAPEAVSYGAAAIRMRLRQLQGAELFDRVAAALRSLRQLYDPQGEMLATREEAIASGGLVLVRQPPAVYWEGQEVAGPWKGILWDFLTELARKARLRSPVAQQDLYPDVKSATVMSRNAERLRKKLPPTLRRLIVPGNAPQTYRLDLEPQRIDFS